MNLIRRIITGESIRETLEGISAAEIVEIVKAKMPPPESSPFAKEVGFYLATEADMPVQKHTPYVLPGKRKR